MVTEHHDGRCHYLFNTDIIEEDLSLFDTPASNNSNSEGRGTVYFKTIESPGGDVKVVVKEYRRGGIVRHFNKRLYCHSHYSQSRVWLEFKLLVKMTAMGLPVPIPVAGRVKKRFPQWYESTIVTREIEHTTTLADRLMTDRPAGSPAVPDLWKETGSTIKRFHADNICHADLNASNILVSDSNNIFLIDFDKGQHLPDTRSNTRSNTKTKRKSRSKINWKTSNLDRLQRSLLKYRRKNDNFQFSEENWDALISGYEIQ